VCVYVCDINEQKTKMSEERFGMMV